MSRAAKEAPGLRFKIGELKLLLLDWMQRREDAVRHLFDELRQALPVRYENAENDEQRRKIRWMADYMNDTIIEQGFSAEWEVVLPASLR
jgi:hypothetical protein